MPSKGSVFSHPVQSAKKQQSISSFFTKTGTSSSSSPQCSVERTQPEPVVLPIAPGRSGQYNSPNVEARPKRNRLVQTSELIPEGSEVAEEEETDSDTMLPRRKRVRTGALDRAGNTLQPQNGNRAHLPDLSERTSKYLFSSSGASIPESVGETSAEVIAVKENLHQRFVKKLGKPDSIIDIKRRNNFITEEIAEADGEEVDDLEEVEPPTKSIKGRRGGTVKKVSSKLTPLERQVIDIKGKHPDTVLVIEVGYKFRFFGEDARTAAKELSIMCIPGKFRFDEHPSEAHLNRFASASIPVHRLHVHVKRLVSAGHKVGVVRQMETAALKAAGDNRNAPFERKLTNLYTKGTYIDDVQSLDEPGGDTISAGYILCITENNLKGLGTDEKVQVGILAVQPATGDIIHDAFEDGFLRGEIETRLLHIAPCELLIVGGLSKATDKLVRHLSGSKTNVFGDSIRVEQAEKNKTTAAQAYSHVSNFYAGRLTEQTTEKDPSTVAILDKVLKLPENVTICLSAMITHLTDYGMDHVFDLTKYFQSFSARSHMLLNGTTITSLEIFQNQTNYAHRGSLFWTLDRTSTRFGQRLFRKWVGRPLLTKLKLEERIAAVEELKDGSQSLVVERLRNLLSRTKSDLEKNLIRVYYGKCTRPELLVLLQTMQKIGMEFLQVKSSADTGFQSSLVNDMIAALPTVLEHAVHYLDKINPQAAKDNDKYSFFRESHQTEDIIHHNVAIVGVEHELNKHRAIAAEKIKKQKVEYVTSSGIEYLIEVDNSQLKSVPASWVQISRTKKLSRFHTPEVVRLIRERDQHKESLAAACDAAFSALLSEVSSKYQVFRDCIQALATLDCLFSLAIVATQPGYVKPEYTEDTCIVIEKGRHPMVEQLLLDAYVPNDTTLMAEQTRALLVTGPNMGGKSSYVRQVALIAIMGQIGSYVPAESAKLGMLDAIFTRMGAFDNMMAGESTFMVELSETSDILKQSSLRSLIILDELGRGTSTHDGVAIAQAVLDHIVRQSKSLLLFITHYQNLSSLAQTFENNVLRNVHMRFEESGNESQDITFLYEIGEGVAHRSYGLNVAKLANVPRSVLDLAAIKSKQLEDAVRYKKIHNLSTMLCGVVELTNIEQLNRAIAGIEEL